MVLVTVGVVETASSGTVMVLVLTVTVGVMVTVVSQGVVETASSGTVMVEVGSSGTKTVVGVRVTK
jgi:hypothetical protein